MTAGILIAVLVGGGLIAFAIRASLGKRRNSREQGVPFSDTKAAGPIPGAPAIREVAGAIKRTVLPLQTVADLAPVSQRAKQIYGALGAAAFRPPARATARRIRIGRSGLRSARAEESAVRRFHRGRNQRHTCWGVGGGRIGA
jgi:hypothetical protein